MKLTDFKDDDAFRVIADLLPHMQEIAANAAVKDAMKQGNMLNFASVMLKETPAAVKAMFAILNNRKPAEYHCNAATVLKDVVTMFSDRDLLELFVSPTQTPEITSFGSASASTEAPEQ